ncbi:glycosyl transferase, partial [Salmonella enterica subsp. enterica serovar Haifa]|nr:glycosyl transferase [Salmonella enterica subsp. enterica serovar Haifa]
MSAPLVVVSAGTYHLPFDRLSGWVEEWLQRHPDVRLVMQHGPSAPVAGAENVEIL